MRLFVSSSPNTTFRVAQSIYGLRELINSIMWRRWQTESKHWTTTLQNRDSKHKHTQYRSASIARGFGTLEILAPECKPPWARLDLNLFLQYSLYEGFSSWADLPSKKSYTRKIH
jgi:hypothetical protein